jgi:hypothetical protein
VQLANVGTAPLMKSGANSIADMGGAPAPLVTTTSAFGVAAGDATAHNQGSVDYAGTPWGALGTTQGTLYRGVPVGGMTVAQRSGPQNNDPVTLNFAAVNANGQLVPNGAYTGTVRLTASVI